jgi:hypothetical protein
MNPAAVASHGFALFGSLCALQVSSMNCAGKHAQAQPQQTVTVMLLSRLML